MANPALGGKRLRDFFGILADQFAGQRVNHRLEIPAVDVAVGDRVNKAHLQQDARHRGLIQKMQTIGEFLAAIIKPTVAIAADSLLGEFLLGDVPDLGPDRLDRCSNALKCTLISRSRIWLL